MIVAGRNSYICLRLTVKHENVQLAFPTLQYVHCSAGPSIKFKDAVFQAQLLDSAGTDGVTDRVTG